MFLDVGLHLLTQWLIAGFIALHDFTSRLVNNYKVIVFVKYGHILSMSRLHIHTAVNLNYLAGNIAGEVAGEVHRSVGNVFNLTATA